MFNNEYAIDVRSLRKSFDNKEVPAKIDTSEIINALFPIVVAKGTKAVYDFYETLINEKLQSGTNYSTDAIRLLWHGYPMWFLAKKFPDCFDSEFQIVLDDYTLWWDLDYGNGENDIDALITAYSNTYLNWPIEKKVSWVDTLAQD